MNQFDKTFKIFQTPKIHNYSWKKFPKNGRDCTKLSKILWSRPTNPESFPVKEFIYKRNLSKSLAKFSSIQKELVEKVMKILAYFAENQLLFV